MSPDVEVLVIGAGLAGSAVATRLARAQKDVLLVERGDFPRDKLCGEFLSAESQAILHDLEAERVLEVDDPVRIGRARFTGPSGRTVTVRLPAPAFGISRRHLDAALFEVAKDSGSKTLTRAEVTGFEPVGSGHRVTIRRPDGFDELSVGTLICAHGRRGRPDRAAERAFLNERHPFVGLKRHHRPTVNAAGAALSATLDDHVEIYPFDGGYCGMSFIETGEVNVCLLAHEDVLRSNGAARPSRPGEHRWDAVMAALRGAHRGLDRRLQALEPTDPEALAVAAVPFTKKAPYERGVFFIGDAAGMIAPLAGDGQAMALESANRLARLLIDRPADPETGRAWNREWRRAFGTRMGIASTLQRLLLRPTYAEMSLRVVGAIPGLADWLGRMTRGPVSASLKA